MTKCKFIVSLLLDAKSIVMKICFLAIICEFIAWTVSLRKIAQFTCKVQIFVLFARRDASTMTYISFLSISDAMAAVCFNLQTNKVSTNMKHILWTFSITMTTQNTNRKCVWMAWSDQVTYCHPKSWYIHCHTFYSWADTNECHDTGIHFMIAYGIRLLW